MSKKSVSSSAVSEGLGWVVALAAAYLVLPPGIEKFTDATAWVARFDGWSLLGPLSYLVGMVEVVVVLLLIVPRLATVGACPLHGHAGRSRHAHGEWRRVSGTPARCGCRVPRCRCGSS